MTQAKFQTKFSNNKLDSSWLAELSLPIKKTYNINKFFHIESEFKTCKEKLQCIRSFALHSDLFACSFVVGTEGAITPLGLQMQELCRMLRIFLHLTSVKDKKF